MKDLPEWYGPTMLTTATGPCFCVFFSGGMWCGVVDAGRACYCGVMSRQSSVVGPPSSTTVDRLTDG
jgi:hypothetical protein